MNRDDKTQHGKNMDLNDPPDIRQAHIFPQAGKKTEKSEQDHFNDNKERERLGDELPIRVVDRKIQPQTKGKNICTNNQE